MYKVGPSHHVPVEHSEVLAADSHDSLLHLVHQVKAVGYGGYVLWVKLFPVLPEVPVPVLVGESVVVDSEGVASRRLVCDLSQYLVHSIIPPC